MREKLMSLICVLVLAACGGQDTADAPAHDGRAAATAAGPEADAVEALGIDHLGRPTPELLTAGQLTPEQMTALAGMGYGPFICLRPENESGTGWEEELAESAGIDFARLPVAGRPDITRENAERLAELLEVDATGPAVVYCASSNRVGALLALRAHYLEGQSAEDALALGRAAGMTRLEPAVREMLGLPEAE